MNSFRSFVRFSRPVTVLGVLILYSLGGGIAHYLGATLDWEVYWLGQAWVTVLQLGAFYLYEFYLAPVRGISPAAEENQNDGQGSVQRSSLLAAAFTCMAVLASLTVLIIAQVRPAPIVYVFMVVAFLIAFFYSAAPFKLETSGYGELLLSFLVAYLTPTFAYLLQEGAWHRLLAMTCFPLTAAHLAMLLAVQLSRYSSDMKSGRRTLLIRLGWQNGMTLHNILVLSAFLLLVLADLYGFPWSITWPVLLALPLGVYQVWQMRAISAGAKPNWPWLRTSAFALFGALAYLFAFGFWVN